MRQPRGTRWGRPHVRDRRLPNWGVGGGLLSLTQGYAMWQRGCSIDLFSGYLSVRQSCTALPEASDTTPLPLRVGFPFLS